MRVKADGVTWNRELRMLLTMALSDADVDVDVAACCSLLYALLLFMARRGCPFFGVASIVSKSIRFGVPIPTLYEINPLLIKLHVINV